MSRRESAAVSSLPRPVATAIIAALLACAAAGWVFTAQQAASTSGMSGMAMLGAGLFLVIWVVMMVAMMFPATVPMVLTHARVGRSRGEGSLPTVAFILGYIVVWAAAGLVPLAVIQIAGSAGGLGGWVPRLGGAVILLAGIYQLTPLKNVCLSQCRSPLAFILTHDFGGGSPAAARAGMSHGLYCLGCCWALMAVLAVLGFMNLAWMAAFAAVFFLEKNWSRGVMLSRIVGVACVVLGFAVMIQPGVLPMVGGSMV